MHPARTELLDFSLAYSVSILTAIVLALLLAAGGRWAPGCAHSPNGRRQRLLVVSCDKAIDQQSRPRHLSLADYTVT